MSSAHPTGFYDLDAMTCGFSPGDLVIVTGRPSMGKSALAAQIGFYVAAHPHVDLRLAVVIFTLKMSKLQLVEPGNSYQWTMTSGRLTEVLPPNTQYHAEIGNERNLKLKTEDLCSTSASY
ncbi:MAG: DnaB-like helicase C-terminal domain-containing protein [Microcystaceae cyanobacterium]